MTNKLFAIHFTNILHAMSLPTNTDHATMLTRTVTVYKVNTNKLLNRRNFYYI